MWKICDRISLSSQWGLTVLAVGLSLSGCSLSMSQANNFDGNSTNHDWAGDRNGLLQ